jgi:hypothetical protein
MGVTGATEAAQDPLSAQINKIVSSDIMRGSDSLCRLLRFFAEQSKGHPGTTVKEYQIATEVFGRSADFDPRLDSTVRVQTSRLRAKLAEYYSSYGLEDSIIVEVPKGAYALAVHRREAEPPKKVPALAQQQLLPAPTSVTVWALSILSLGLTVATGYLLLTRPSKATPPAEKVPEAVRIMWASFVDRPQEPLVIFSNAEFVGRPETGMRYFDAAKGDKGAILDHYTGVGEVLAVHELDRLFGSLHHGLRVKRGRLLSLDDAKNNDLIFIGSPSENLTLRDVPTTREFVFRSSTSGPRKGDLAIVNLRKQPGESDSYFGSDSVPIEEDYALIGFVPGLTPSNVAVILAGTTTIGTQAAVEFVCRPASVSTLVERVGQNSSGEIGTFEAVIRVKVSRGVPVKSELVALHRREN